MNNNIDFLEHSLWNNRNALNLRSFLNTNQSFLLKLHAMSLNKMLQGGCTTEYDNNFLNGYLRCIKDINSLSQIEEQELMSDNDDD